MTVDQFAEALRELVSEAENGGLEPPALIEGTAQFGPSAPLKSHAWVIAWAGPPGQTPTIAVAVLVEGQDGASEQTGGRVAAPIAKAVIEAALRPPPAPPADTTTTTAPAGGGG